uniref:Uncharacterized protein n=1 Tax=Rhizophora mucronata TaxID=61149 RepID=A0A2P2LLV3_RHIMU
MLFARILEKTALSAVCAG